MFCYPFRNRSASNILRNIINKLVYKQQPWSILKLSKIHAYFVQGNFPKLFIQVQPAADQTKLKHTDLWLSLEVWRHLGTRMCGYHCGHDSATLCLVDPAKLKGYYFTRSKAFWVLNAAPVRPLEVREESLPELDELESDILNTDSFPAPQI